jgi:hypothetical protein
MGDGDWSIETYITWDDLTWSDGYDINLIVGFDRFDQLWLSSTYDERLQVIRVGVGEIASVDISLPLCLRIEKTGSEYEFKYKTDPEDPEWSLLDVEAVSTPVAYVGVMGRNWTGGSDDMVMDLDYFRLERYGEATPAPYTETTVDNFTGPDLAPEWEWYVPKSGPVYTVNNGFISRF